MTTTTDLTTVPAVTPAWWLHWCNVALSVAAFIGVGIHPGWHPPAVAVDLVLPVATILAVGSGLFFAVEHRRARESVLSSVVGYVRTASGALASAAESLVPLIDRYPSLERRLTALETAAPTVTPELAALLARLSPPSAPTAPTPAPSPPAAPGAT